VTPAQRGSGIDLDIFEKRNKTIDDARANHPERWGKKIRKWENLDVVILNPDIKESQSLENVA